MAVHPGSVRRIDRESEDPMTFRRQQVTYPLPAPAAMPGAVDHNVIGHFGESFPKYILGA